MDLVWNNLLTCDYERTRPGASRLETRPVHPVADLLAAGPAR